MVRISSIDIGSNAIRQLIVEIKPLGEWKVLKKHRENIRLGTDVFDDGHIHPKTQQRLILAFKRMAKLNKKWKVTKNLAYATSAFRDAHNAKSVASEIYKSSGIRVEVISGAVEARLIRLAVQQSIGIQHERCLLIDIGGGSVELTSLHKSKINFSKSIKWGMVRMLAEAQKMNVPVQQHLRQKFQLEKNSLPKGFFDVAIGTGGNIDSIARLKLTVLGHGPNTIVTHDELKKLYQEFMHTPTHLRQSRFNLKPDRVDVLEPALFLTLALMKKYRIKKMKVPGTGLKEGAILSMIDYC